jgi:hypothetical protein
MLFTGHLVDFILAGIVAGLIILASHCILKQIDFHPHVFVSYVFGSLVWMVCATITVFQAGSQDVILIAIGYWVVLLIAGLFDILAFGLDRLGALNRAKRIKKEVRDERNFTV